MWGWPSFVSKFLWNEEIRKSSGCVAELILGCLNKHPNGPAVLCLLFISPVQWHLYLLVFLHAVYNLLITFLAICI